jgi:Tfp pilus assembly protein PilP
MQSNFGRLCVGMGAVLALAAGQAQAGRQPRPGDGCPSSWPSCGSFSVWVTISPSTADDAASFTYAAGNLRSPFLPSGAESARSRPLRTREFLEQFPLDTLRMGGTLRVGGQVSGLVQSKGGLVTRVAVGDHIGQAEGRIIEITPTRIILVEIVPDSPDGYERPAALALNE